MNSLIPRSKIEYDSPSGNSSQTLYMSLGLTFLLKELIISFIKCLSGLSSLIKIHAVVNASNDLIIL